MKISLILNALVLEKQILTPLTKIQSTYEITANSRELLFDINYNTVLQMAMMSYNTYSDGYWYDVELNQTIDLTNQQQQVHAFLFSDVSKQVNVVAIKGTSAFFQPSTRQDKFNDNLYFSCCFHKETTIGCDVEDNPLLANICSSKCYKESLNFPDNYISKTIGIIEQLHKVIDFSNSLVAFTGHSLGGALATFMGIEYSKQVITFQAPGELHYLQLAKNVYRTDYPNVYHFGHDADVIFTGKCNGWTSWCYWGGYIMKTKCHVGKVCMYNVVEKLGIKESIMTHTLQFVINQVITKWNNTLPACQYQSNCLDCAEWKFNAN